MKLSQLPRIPANDHPWSDFSRSPLVIARYPAVTSEEEVMRFFTMSEEWMKTIHTPWALVFDFSLYDAKTSTPAKRRIFADGQRQMEAMLDEHCLGIGVVAPSAIMRGVITAVSWFHRPPVPLHVVSSLDAAIVWVEKIAEGLKRA